MRRRHPHRHVSRLYERIARRKGHPKAIGAAARHLAEVTVTPGFSTLKALRRQAGVAYRTAIGFWGISR
jgi:hypothetical protein